MFFSTFMLTLSLAMTAESSLNGVNLTPKPNSCVSLRQGKTCYTPIEISWQTQKIEDYCLYMEGKEQPIKCWKRSNRGSIEFDFQSSETLAFQLRAGVEQVTVAQTKVSVGWVYNSSNKKRRWRIF